MTLNASSVVLKFESLAEERQRRRVELLGFCRTTIKALGADPRARIDAFDRKVPKAEQDVRSDAVKIIRGYGHDLTDKRLVALATYLEVGC